MKLIVGLGNPGSQYEQTRHNVGFRILDALATKYGWRWERRGRAMLANGVLENEKVVLVKPLTYMNNSGEAVGELLRWYKLQPEDLLIIYDELDLPPGKLRLRANGSGAGHNGLRSIVHHLHTQQIPRLRIGIGRPLNHRVENINHVLGVPPGDERIILSTAEDRAVEAIPLILRQGIHAAMNSINADPEAERKAEERRLQQEQRKQERLRRLQEEQQAREQNAGTQVAPDAANVETKEE
jgi:PTH1 family peptidyl-tRNA hydrolase